MGYTSCHPNSNINLPENVYTYMIYTFILHHYCTHPFQFQNDGAEAEALLVLLQLEILLPIYT